MRGRAALDQAAIGEVALVGEGHRGGWERRSSTCSTRTRSYIALGGSIALIGEGDRSRDESACTSTSIGGDDVDVTVGTAAPHPRPPRRRLAALGRVFVEKCRRSTGAPSFPTACSWALWMNWHRTGTGSVPGTGHCLLRNAAWQRAPVGSGLPLRGLVQPAAEAATSPEGRPGRASPGGSSEARAPRGGSARRR